MSPAIQAIELLFTPGEWFQFPMRLLRHMKPAPCVLFSYLAGYSRLLGRDGGENNGWFYRTVDDVFADTRMTEDIQYRYIKSLVELGILETKQAGLPAIRYFRVNWERVVVLLNSEEPLDSAKMRELEPGVSVPAKMREPSRKNAESGPAKMRDRERSIKQKKRENEPRTPSALPGREPDGFEPRQQPIVPAKPFQEEASSAAAKLLAMLQEHRKVMHIPAMPKWVEVFRKFYEDCPAASRSRIAAVLAWYCKHYGEPFVPDARSAMGFVEKFESIDKAMDRAARDAKRGGNNGLPPGVRCARTMTNRDPDLPWEFMGQYLNVNDDGDFDENCRDSWMRAVYGTRLKKNIWSEQIYLTPEVEKELIAALEAKGIFAKKVKPYRPEVYDE